MLMMLDVCHPWQQDSWGRHGAHLGRQDPCGPHENCYLGSNAVWCDCNMVNDFRISTVDSAEFTYVIELWGIFGKFEVSYMSRCSVQCCIIFAQIIMPIVCRMQWLHSTQVNICEKTDHSTFVLNSCFKENSFLPGKLFVLQTGRVDKICI